MIQEVKFKGLTHSPSDYEAQDGELGTCLNLINEDGALKPIPKAEVVESFSLPNDSCSIRYVHKVIHDDEVHSHYIVNCANGSPYSWYWTEKGGDGTQHKLNLEDFKVNAVTAIGYILCFVGDENTKYAFWDGNTYSLFDNSAFTYNIVLKDQTLVGKQYSKSTEVSVLFEDDWDAIWAEGWKYASNTSGNAKNAKASSIVLNGIDATINKLIEETDKYTFKYISFGVVALLLYDGTYKNISMPFVLAPAFVSNKFVWRDSKKKIGTSFNMHSHTICINLDLPKEISELILGADVYLSQPESFLDTEKAFYTIANSWNYLYNETTESDVYSFAMDFMSKKDIYKTIDNLSFFKSIRIDKEDFGKDVKLERVIETSETLSLADFKRRDYGGKVSYCYNNRLHIGNVKESTPNVFSMGFKNDFGIKDVKNADNKYDIVLNNRLELAKNNGKQETYTVKAVIVTYIVKNSIEHQIYEACNIQMPLSPIISYPDSNATKIVIYFYDGSHYYKKEMVLHQSETFGMAYYINVGNGRKTDAVLGSGSNFKDDFGGRTDSETTTTYPAPTDVTMLLPDDYGIPSFIQDGWFLLKKTTISTSLGTSEVFRWDDGISTSNGQLTMSTEEEFAEIENKAANSSKYCYHNPSLIKVSEAENPLVFPAKNSVQVGSSVVNALAANTRPISEGQFGEAPLYAFTDEGVWVLMTGTEGTYQARQPVNRYICNNPNGILQIDDAVLFPTEHGIMMQQGSQVVCITDQLDGYPFDFTQLYKTDYAKKVLAVNGTDAAAVRYARFRNFLENADMVYDYYDSRIIVFNPNYKYAYVYSLKSKMWGTMESNFSKRVNIYPESYAVNKDGKIVDVYVKNHATSVPYFLCSRPLVLSENERYKTMFSCIARGYFHSTEKGKCGIVLYGSNDLFTWFPIKTSVNKYLRGMAGSPYKYFRIAMAGSLSPVESISGLSTDFQERWQNKLR